jgi:hypothetical protein
MALATLAALLMYVSPARAQGGAATPPRFPPPASAPPVASTLPASAAPVSSTAPARPPVSDAPPATLPTRSTATSPAASEPDNGLTITAINASTWSNDRSNIVQLDGPVTILLPHTRMSARQAVVWIEPAPAGTTGGDQLATVVLIGDAALQQPGLRRSGPQLLVSTYVQGPIRITAENRLARDLSRSEAYRTAMTIRSASAAAPGAVAPGAVAPAPLVLAAPPPASQPAGATADRPSAGSPIFYHGGTMQSIPTAEGKPAIVLTDGVSIHQRSANGDFLEMQSKRAVIYLALNRLRDAAQLKKVDSAEDVVTGAYLEGDVRINQVPASAASGLKSEQRLEAERVFYDFTSDRAILTDAVLHTVDPQLQIPLVVRAHTIRQLSKGEYNAGGAEMSTSTFAVPSYSIRTDKLYVRQEDTGDPRLGTRTVFSARGVQFDLYHVPVFYFPALAGEMTERGSALRDIQFGNNRYRGFNIRTEWGLFETLGVIPPSDLDISYRIDYFGERGAGLGLNGDYGGGFVNDSTKRAWNFQGKWTTFFLPDDEGIDNLGRRRGKIDPVNDFRGEALWEHQHFFPDDWQLQLRAGWLSDPTFREFWFPNEFDNGLPVETSAYFKRQKDSEAMTLLLTLQPNNFVTSAEHLQENFEIERFPEVGYHRIGDSLFGDTLTFFSNDSFSRLRFQQSKATLGDEGFRFARGVRPGQPSEGLVGISGLNGPPDVPESYNNRADFRQEVDYPFSLGQFRVMPYVMGRYTYYTHSPVEGAINRLYAGTGVRVNTTFWKTDDSVENELFDIHRVRHIIEPELHAFTSVTNKDPDELFIYDEPIDKTYDISALQLALRQRWQTKRGAPGWQRSVDFFTLNIEGNMFFNQPSQLDLAPNEFRSIFYSSLPEASVPRNGINADSSWRISDTTVMLADTQWNADKQNLATAGVGMVARRDYHIGYFIGMRYIEELNSAVTTVAASYELSKKYSLGFRESFDFSNDGNVYSAITVRRRFDRFFAMLTVYNNSNDGESGFSVGLFPEGLGQGFSSDALQSAFGGR